MLKSKKKMLTLIISLVLLGGLGGLYVWQDNRTKLAELDVEPSPTPTPLIMLIEKNESDLEYVIFESKGRTLKLDAIRKPNEFNADLEDISWALSGYEDVFINQTAAKDMVRGMYYQSPIGVLLEETDNPADFGLSPGESVVTARYRDGSATVMRVGKETPAKDRYYMSIDGDPAVYLMYTYLGARFFNGLNELVDKSVSVVETQFLEYIKIAERGRPLVEFTFHGTDEDKDNMYEQYGGIYLTMNEPYHGRDLYYESFDMAVMEEFLPFSIGELIELAPNDLSVYGLDEPSLELRLSNRDNDLHLFFGDLADENLIYVMIAGRPHVFTADYSYVSHIFGINVFRFIDKFIVLEDIYSVEVITIKTSDAVYEILMEQYELPAESSWREGEFDSYVNPYINGQLVHEQPFKTFYRFIIGQTYDADIGYVFEPEGEPIVTVSFVFTEKEPTTIKYFPFDANFCAVQIDDGQITHITNLQAIHNMLNAIPELLAGNMDGDY